MAGPTINKFIATPANNSYIGDWDVPVNSNWNIIDACLAGVTSLTTTTGSYALTQTQCQSIVLFTSAVLTGNVTYIIPAGVSGQWLFDNSSTGAFTITVSSGAGGSTLVIPQGYRGYFYCYGVATGSGITGCVSAMTAVASLNVYGALTVSGATSLQGTTTTTLAATAVTATTVAATGAVSGVGVSAGTGQLSGATLSITDGSWTVDSTGGMFINGTTVSEGTGTLNAVANGIFAGGVNLFPNAPVLASSQTLGSTGGRAYLPGGLIIQWGTSSSGTSPTTITFSGVTGCIAFPNYCYSVVVSAYNVSTAIYASISAFSKTAFTTYNSGSSSGFFWIAIGS